MSHTNLSAAEIALLNSQLPDIGGAIRGKPVTSDGDGWRVGRWSFVSIRSGCGQHRSASPPAPPRWSPLQRTAPGKGADPGGGEGPGPYNTAIRPRRATATAVVVADPHNHQPERSLRPMSTVSGKRYVKQIVYDLEKHWLFWKDTGGEVTLEELERQAHYEPNIRGQAIFGDPLRTKPVRVLVNISAEGLSLWETGKHISHRWADRTPPDLSGFAELLKGILP